MPARRVPLAALFVDQRRGHGLCQTQGQTFRVADLFLGFGEPVAKSVLLLLLSKHPPLPPELVDFLMAAFVLLGAGARPAPSKQLAVVP